MTDATTGGPRGERPTAVPQRRPRRRPTLRGEAPTDTIPLVGSLRGTPYRDPRVTRAVAEERAATEALDLALRVSELMLRCGASARTVEAAAVAVGVASGLDDMDVDLTMQSMLIQCRTSSGATYVRLRVVRTPHQDFGRLAAVHSLVDDLVSGEIDTEQAATRLREIATHRRTWARWMIGLAHGMVGAGVALTLGAGALAIVVALIGAAAVDGALRVADRLKLPDFYLGAIGGAVSTVIAFTGYALGDAGLGLIQMTSRDFAFVMAGGIVMLLPSRSLTSAMEDVLTGYPVTGTSRLFEVLLHTVGLILGVGAALGVSLQVTELLELGLLQPQVSQLAWAEATNQQSVLIGSLVVGIGGTILAQNTSRMFVPVALLATLVVYLAATLGGAGVGRVTSAGIAAVVLGFVARLVAIRLDAPSVTLAVPASYGLMPGLSIFIGLYQMSTQGDEAFTATTDSGLVAVLAALGVIFAIASGSTLGELLAAPLDSSVAERRRLIRRLGQRPAAVGYGGSSGGDGGSAGEDEPHGWPSG